MPSSSRRRSSVAARPLLPFAARMPIYGAERAGGEPADRSAIFRSGQAMRFILNLVGGLLLALALVFAVADIARSLADGAMRLGSIGEVLAALGMPLGADGGLSANAVDLVAAVSGWPASVSFGLAAFLFLFVGRPPHRRGSRRFAR
jgi:hypothetical protein